MRSKLIFFIVLSVLGVSPVLAVQSCNSANPFTAQDERYHMHSDGTVTDTATGLMWMQCTEGQSGHDCTTGMAETYNWHDALSIALSSNHAEYEDWRLPNIKELASLVESRCDYPAVNVNVFPNTPSSGFWSASPSVADTFYAWGIDFNYGYDYDGNKDNEYHVRLVRDGQ